jgi:hypothetical protein
MSKAPRTFTQLGVALICLSLCLLVLQGYVTFVISAAIGASIGIIALGFIITNREAIRFSWLIPATLLVGYAGGVISTWINTASFEEFAYATKGRPFLLLSITLATVYACCGIALVAGRFESPCFKPDQVLPQANKFSLALVIAGLVVILAAYINGDFGYMGIQVDESTRRISALGAIAELVAAPTAGFCGYMIGRSKPNYERLLYAIAAVAALVSIIPSGRRLIVLALLVVAIGFSLSGGLRRVGIAKIILAAVSFGAFAYLTTSYFYALRLSNWELGPTSQLSDQLSLAFEFLVSPTLNDRFGALLAENIRERTFTIGYFADLVEATYKSGPLYGEALMFYVRVAIPSVLDPSKSAILDYQQIENLAHPKLGLPVIDQANSVFTDGVTDFGVPGALIYLFGIILFLRTTYWVLQRFPAPVSCLVAALVLIHLALKPELTLADYFVTVRNLAFIFPILFVLERVLTLRPGVLQSDSEGDGIKSRG